MRLVLVVVLLARVAGAKTAVIGADEAGRAPDARMVQAAAKRTKDSTLVGSELVQALRLDGLENAVLDGRAAASLSNQVARGLQAWRAGDFQRAIGELQPAQEELLAHPAWVAEDVAHRELLRGALVGLAMSLKRLGKPGDVNGDGFDDVIVGSSSRIDGNAAGRAYVYFGGGETFDGTADVIVRGVSNYLAGVGVAGVGDMNADGFDDVVVGTPIRDEPYEDAGAAWVILGSSVPDGDPDGALMGGNPGGKLGTAIAGLFRPTTR